MIKIKVQYNVGQTKVMAMYGILFKDNEWRRSSDCRNASEIGNLFRSHSIWNEIIAQLQTNPDAKTLKTAVLKRIYEKYEKLYGFLLAKNKKGLCFLSYRTEYNSAFDALKKVHIL